VPDNRGAARHLNGTDLGRARLYLSDQAHHSVKKAARIAGLPASAMRLVPTCEGRRIDPAAARGGPCSGPRPVPAGRDRGARPTPEWPTRSPSSPRSPPSRSCGSTSTAATAASSSSPTAAGPASRESSAPTRSRSIRTRASSSPMAPGCCSSATRPRSRAPWPMTTGVPPAGHRRHSAARLRAPRVRAHPRAPRAVAPTAPARRRGVPHRARREARPGPPRPRPARRAPRPGTAGAARAQHRGLPGARVATRTTARCSSGSTRRAGCSARAPSWTGG
jgi:hypothetical protein